MVLQFIRKKEFILCGSWLHSVSCFFFLYLSSSLYLWTGFYSILPNIDKVLMIKLAANVPVFILQWISIHREIMNVLLSEFLLTFHQTEYGMLRFITWLIKILVLVRKVFVIIWEMFHGRISLKLVLLLQIVNFSSGFRFEWLYISAIISIRSSLTHHHGFQTVALLP